jgi:hypothetical protein
MLQVMDNMDASCVFYVKVGMFTHLEHGKIYLLAVNQTEIVKLIAQHILIVSVGSMLYPLDYLRPTSADSHALERYPNNILQSCVSASDTLQYITVQKRTTSD